MYNRYQYVPPTTELDCKCSSGSDSDQEIRIINNVIKDTIYFCKPEYITKYITRYVPEYITKYFRDTIFMYNDRYLRDTIYNNRVDTIFIHPDHEKELPNNSPPHSANSKVTKKKSNGHLSVYAGAGPMMHDIRPDEYINSYYKLSYSGFVGATYKFNNRVSINGEVNYSAPYQFLYNSQYIGAGITGDYDFLKSNSNDLKIGTGLEYDHSYNKRTVTYNDKVSTSKYLKTNNIYLPVKVSYEHKIGKNYSIGTFVRYRRNVVGQDLSHDYFLDGGVQLRYNFRNNGE